MELSQRLIWSVLTVLYTVLSHVRCQDMPMHMFTEFSEFQPVLDTTRLSIQAVVGSTAELPCNVKNSGSALVTWMREQLFEQISTGSEIIMAEEMERMQVRHNTEDEFTLIINNVQLGDETVYTCMVQVFPPLMKEISLTVYSLPIIGKGELEDRYIFKEGHTVSISCPVSGWPSPTVQWYAYKDSPASLEDKEEEKEIFSNTSTLFIRQIKRVHDGIYRCVAKNEYGSDMYEIYVQTAYAPVPKTNKKHITVREGDIAELYCEAESTPLPTLTWQRHQDFLESNNKYMVVVYPESETKMSTELNIHVVKSDEGRYICLATNAHGQNHVIIHLTVESDTTVTTQPPTPKTTRSTTATIKASKAPSKTTSTVSKPGNLENKTKKTTPVTDTETPRAGPISASATSAQASISLLSIVLSTLVLLLIAHPV